MPDGLSRGLPGKTEYLIIRVSLPTRHVERGLVPKRLLHIWRVFSRSRLTLPSSSRFLKGAVLARPFLLAEKPTFQNHFLFFVSVRAHPVTFSMALLQYQAPVDYAAQLDAFKDFLQHFKTLQSTSEAAATEAMEDLNIDGDRTSDEYDFMDDVDDEGAGTRGASRRREPKLKYMQILQDIANREASNIVIELDDLDVVSVNKNSVAFTIPADKDYL